MISMPKEIVNEIVKMSLEMRNASIGCQIENINKKYQKIISEDYYARPMCFCFDNIFRIHKLTQKTILQYVRYLIENVNYISSELVIFYYDNLKFYTKHNQPDLYDIYKGLYDIQIKIRFKNIHRIHVNRL